MAILSPDIEAWRKRIAATVGDTPTTTPAPKAPTSNTLTTVSSPYERKAREYLPSTTPTGGTPVLAGPQTPTNPYGVVAPTAATPATPTMAPTTNPLAPAAGLLSGALRGSYGVNPQMLAQLQAGQLPQLNTWSQGWWNRLSPVLQQSLQGLYQAGGVPQEELMWSFGRGAPTAPGYRRGVYF